MGNTQKTGYLQNLIQYDGSGNIVLPGTLTISTNKLVATQEYVGTQVAALVNSAPSTLDTLNELAAALGNDPNFATTVASSIGSKVPTTRTLTINGTAYDLSADRSWTIVGGVSSFNTRTGAITLTDTDVTGALGYTPVTNARTLTINGTAYDLSADRSWTIGATSSARNIQTITADGTTATYTVTNGYVVGLVDVYRNGVKLGAADITATNGTTVTLGVTPASGDIIEIVNYVTALTQNNALRTVNTFNVGTATNTFTVSYTQGLLDVYYNGSKLTPAEYTATNGTSVVLSTNAAVGSVVEIITYNYSVSGFSGIGGGGTTNYLPKFTGASTIGNSLIYTTGVYTSIGTTATHGNLTIEQTTGESGLVINSSIAQSPTLYLRDAGSVGYSTIVTNNKLYINSSNVGIGTSSPSGKFEVLLPAFTNEDTDSQMAIFGSGSGGRGVRIGYSQANSSGYIYSLYPNVAWQDLKFAANNMIFCGGGSTERMRITSTGNVQIGATTDMGSRLYVIGGGGQGAGWIQQDSAPPLYLNRTGNDGGEVIFLKAGTQVGTINTNSYSLPSDANFKKNVETLDLGLNLVSKLRSVSYNHKIDDEGSALSTGFIAQELEQALTELGVEQNKYHILQHIPNEKEGESQYWLDYSKLIPVLVNSIQELKAEIEILKAK